MIQFRRVGSGLRVSVETGLACDRPVVELECQFGAPGIEVVPEALARRMRVEFRRRVRAAQREAYGAGFADGRAHRGKRDEFSGTI